MAKCPHKEVRFCPLYIAAHTAAGLGCDDGKMGDGHCAVARGLSYVGAVRKIVAKLPCLAEQAKWAESAEQATDQRRRNLRLNGIH